jgi:hypothetical protein
MVYIVSREGSGYATGQQQLRDTNGTRRCSRIPVKGTQKTTTHNIKYLLDDSFVAITQQNCQQHKIKFVIHTITLFIIQIQFLENDNIYAFNFFALFSIPMQKQLQVQTVVQLLLTDNENMITKNCQYNDHTYTCLRAYSFVSVKDGAHKYVNIFVPYTLTPIKHFTKIFFELTLVKYLQA